MHDLYLAPTVLELIIMLLGFDLLFGSIAGIAVTLTLSIPSAVFRARVEDKLLRKRFGKDWENYADKVGFLLPKFRRKKARPLRCIN